MMLWPSKGDYSAIGVHFLFSRQSPIGSDKTGIELQKIEQEGEQGKLKLNDHCLVLAEDLFVRAYAATGELKGDVPELSCKAIAAAHEFLEVWDKTQDVLAIRTQQVVEDSSSEATTALAKKEEPPGFKRRPAARQKRKKKK